MENNISSVSKQNDYYNATKTDLSLLLECLKYQMKCPDSQKQALLTIYSICQQREKNVDLFRDMGGVVFVYNLSKSSCHSEVRETALFTLGMLAEINVYCKQALCKREMFSDLAGCLMQQECPLTQRRVAVYLLSVLVASNRSGQTFAQTSGCLDILLNLFGTSFPLSDEVTVKPANVTQQFQLWTSVSSALCSCVNNPQNEENQRICVTAFPFVKSWLQQLSDPRKEMVQPICSFIAMTVANNYCAQESFSKVGGLKTLTLILIRLASDATHSPSACQLSVIMTKTLSACITDNSVLASGLASLGLVSQLHSLLSSPLLEPQDRLVVILALGHCTDASEEHQSQLLQCGGLSLIITLLTESTSPELRKAAAFILHTCKQAAGCLRGVFQGEIQSQSGDMEAYWRSARHMLHRINQLERQQAQGVEENTPNSLNQPLPSTLPVPQSYPQHHSSSPCWDGTEGDSSYEDTLEVWRGATHGRGGVRSHEGRGEKKVEELGLSCERTPARTVSVRGGRLDRARYGERETTVLPLLTRRGRHGHERDQRGREENHATIRGQDLMDQVRRQIFQAREERQEVSSRERDREGRQYTHTVSTEDRQHTHTDCTEDRQHTHIDSTEDRQHTHTYGQSHSAACSPIGADQEQHCHPGAKRGNKVHLYTDTLKEKGRNTVSHAHVHTQTVMCGVQLPGVRQQQPTSPGCSQRKEQPHTLSAVAHAGSLVPSRCLGKAPESRPPERHCQDHTHSQVFKCPAQASGQTRMIRRMKQWDNEDALSVCSELLDSEISMMLETPPTGHNPTYRCSGCVLRFGEVTSRSFATLQRSCPHSCDLHLVLQQATHRYTQHLRDRRNSQNTHITGRRETQRQTHSAVLREAESQRQIQRLWDHCRDVSLTPLKKRGLCPSITLTPVCRGGLMKHFSPVTSRGQGRDRRTPKTDDDGIDDQQQVLPMTKTCLTSNPSNFLLSFLLQRRERRNFSCDEERYLCQGVQRFGTSWNAILWAYPFHPGRTSVDLAKKYKRMQSKA